MTDTPAPTSAPAPSAATPTQAARMESIQQVATILHDAEVPYLLIASPDDASPTMRFVRSTRLAYSADLKDMATNVGLCRSQMLSISLKHLSVGLKASLAIIGPDGKVICSFKDGEATETAAPRVVG